MSKNRVTEAVVIILLLFSVLSAVYISIKSRTGERVPSFGAVSAKHQNLIGVVEIFGPIYAPYDQGGLFSGSLLTDVLDTLEEFRKDKNVKAVILRINSPGGTIGAVQEITREVNRVRESGKPVVASVIDIGASGGYYIAAACDKIIVNGGSLIGSIGVIFTSADMSKLLEKIGIDMQTVKSGPYKDVGSFYRSFKPEEKDFLGNVINDAYEQFVSVVSAGREIPVERVQELAKGQIYSGRDAVKLKLADTIGDFNAARSTAEELAGIKESKIIRRPYGTLRKLFKIFGYSGLQLDILKKQFTGFAYLYRD